MKNLLIVVFIALILRLTFFENNSLWLDELFSLDFSNPLKSLNEVVKLTLEDVHPPLYQLLLWMWLKLFGYTEFVAQLLSVFFGILVVITSYFFTKEFYNKNIALAVSLIFSTNIFLIFYSQEVRSYQLTVIFAMLSFLYFYKTLISQKTINLFLYWLFTILWIYTHYFSFFMILSQFIFILIYLVFIEKEKRLIKNTLFSIIVFTVAVLPLLPYILNDSNADKFSFFSTPSILYFIEYIHYYFGRGGIFFVLLGTLLTLYFSLTIKLEKKEKIFLLILFTWVFFGFLLPYIKSILSSPLVSPRYFIIMIPPIVLLSIFGITKLNKKLQILIFVIFMGFSCKVLFFDKKELFFKHQYKQVLQYVSKYNFVPIYELIASNGHNEHNTNHFQVYSDLLDLNLKIKDDTSFSKDLDEKNLPNCFWTIYTYFSPTLQNIEEVLKIYKIESNKGLNIVHKKTFHGSQAVLLSNSYDKECKNILTNNE